MQKHIIYLATDANRSYIETGYCQNITQRLFELQEVRRDFLFGKPMLGRIVHIEEFPTSEEAQKRKSELSGYTHMMKERIIRKSNPNWLNIAMSPILSNKKVVAYASA